MYCTQQDLIDEFGEQELIELTDPNNGTIDAVVVDRAIARADTKINQYLSGSTGVEPSTVIYIAVDLVRYFLYKNEVPDLIKKRYDDAVKDLKEMATSQLALASADGSTAKAGGVFMVDSSPSLFGRESRS